MNYRLASANLDNRRSVEHGDGDSYVDLPKLQCAVRRR
jgi:hypothetical protein